MLCGSLFSGAGLLDLGLHQAGIRHVWMCESDPWRRELLRTRFGVPVYEDVRAIQGQAPADTTRSGREQRTKLDKHAQRVVPTGGDVERRGASLGGVCTPVDLIAGGFPCKGASSAGKRNGFDHAETVLWHKMARVIRDLRPRYVLIENVADIRSMAATPGEPAGSLWGTVVADLAALGFGDIQWDCIPAAAVGAPHLRDRVFCVAARAAQQPAAQPRGDDRGRHHPRRESPIGGSQAAANTARDASRGSAAQPRADGERARACAREAPADTECVGCRKNGPALREGRSEAERGVAVGWGEYGPAIRRWEAIHGTAPEPLVRRLDDGNPQLQRMRARVDRSRLSALGDGVHVYVGWLVGEYLMSLERGRLETTT